MGRGDKEHDGGERSDGERAGEGRGGREPGQSPCVRPLCPVPSPLLLPGRLIPRQAAPPRPPGLCSRSPGLSRAPIKGRAGLTILGDEPARGRRGSADWMSTQGRVVVCGLLGSRRREGRWGKWWNKEGKGGRCGPRAGTRGHRAAKAAFPAVCADWPAGGRRASLRVRCLPLSVPPAPPSKINKQ